MVFLGATVHKRARPSGEGPSPGGLTGRSMSTAICWVGDFPGIMARIREAGGEVLQEPQDMGPMIGTLAFFRDTEGNRIGVHQPPAEM
jgi:predicted enzyme related to lactoylglutathione lyase